MILLRSEAVRARKDHTCIWCGQRIWIGEVYQYYCGVMDGDFQSSHMHPECHHAMYQDMEECKIYGEYCFEPLVNQRGQVSQP